MNKNPILITGIHRSSSTFVGKMLTLNKNIAYIQEPFNRYYGLECIDARFKYLANREQDKQLEQILDNLIQLNDATYNITSVTEEEKVIVTRTELFSEMVKNSNLKNIHKYVGKLLFRSNSQLRFNLLKYTPGIDRILLKDPEAAFASQYLSQRYNMDVVVLVRHPLSFAGSLKRLGWRFDFDNFLRQKKLMNNHLADFKKELTYLKKKDTTVIEEACMVWNCVYTVLADFINQNPSFIVYTHEQIAQHPLQSFRKLYNRLGLNFTPTVKQRIRELTSRDNPIEADNNQVHQFNRNSAGLIHKWRKILTSDEISYIKRKTENVCNTFYSPNFFEKIENIAE